MHELKVGQHLVRIEDDTVFLSVSGTMNEDETIKVHREIEKIIEALQRVFIIVDNRHGSGITPEARRFIGEWNRRYQASGVAVFGNQGATGRALIAIVFAVIRIFRSDSLPLVWVKGPAEARLWVAAERQKLLRSSASPPAP